MQDPDNMIEIAPIRGCVPKMIRDTLNYLKTNIIQKIIHKPENTERSVVVYNYNNRRLGEFLKELNLTEGRATGIPTIQQKLQENGSPRATIETDEERTFFLIDIPCNRHCLGVPVIKDDKKDDKKELTDIQRVLVSVISENDKITISEMARKTELSESTISREIKRLRVDHKILDREGGRKNGHWVITK